MTLKTPQLQREDRIGTGPPRARTQVIYVDLRYWASGLKEVNWMSLTMIVTRRECIAHKFLQRVIGTG